MAQLSRYRSDVLFNGNRLGTAEGAERLRRAVRSGMISTDEYILKENERLDQIAATRYGDGRLWWVIAAASGIGWALQVPPGTVLTIPIDLAMVSKVM